MVLYSLFTPVNSWLVVGITRKKGLKLFIFRFIIKLGGGGSDYLVLVHFKVVGSMVSSVKSYQVRLGSD